MDINIAGLDKGAVLAALHNAARAMGYGIAHDIGRDLTATEGRGILAKREVLGRGQYDLDYICGRPIKTNIGGDHIDPRLFDRDAGAGAAERAIATLRPSSQRAAVADDESDRRPTGFAAFASSDYLSDETSYESTPIPDTPSASDTSSDYSSGGDFGGGGGFDGGGSSDSI